MATEAASAARIASRDSITTVAAIGVVACALADMTHEVLGHVVAASLLGVRIVSLSTVAIQTLEASRAVAAAGSIANLVVGALSLVIFNRTDTRKSLSYFLWVFAAFNLLNSGYLVASALLNNGDWAAVIRGLTPEWAWRCALGAVGAAVYWASIRWLARSIARRMNHQVALADLRRLVTTVYLAGGTVLTLASVFNPISPKLIVISGVGASFVLSAGLLAVPRIVRNRMATAPHIPCAPAPLSFGWLGTGIVVGFFFVAVFGPGIRFRAVSAQLPPPPADLAKAPWFSEGRTVWIDIPAGRLKTRVYEATRISEHPVLVVLVHGDIPDPRQGLYDFAQRIAHGTENVVAVGMIRPGYRDAQGDISSGEMGYAIGDNYTPEVVDAVDTAIRELKGKYHARAVVLIGHSGGGAISADLIGRHPEDVDAALLLACGCDPREFMTRWIREHPIFPKDLPNRSLLPLDLAATVPPRMHVRMVIGEKDDVARIPASQAYARSLQARGVDVKLTIAPGFSHNDIFRAPETRAAMTELLTLEGAKVVPTPPAGAARP